MIRRHRTNVCGASILSSDRRDEKMRYARASAAAVPILGNL